MYVKYLRHWNKQWFLFKAYDPNSTGNRAKLMIPNSQIYTVKEIVSRIRNSFQHRRPYLATSYLTKD